MNTVYVEIKALCIRYMTGPDSEDYAVILAEMPIANVQNGSL